MKPEVVDNAQARQAGSVLIKAILVSCQCGVNVTVLVIIMITSHGWKPCKVGNVFGYSHKVIIFS